MEIIDTRDLDKRLNGLESELESLESAIEDAEEAIADGEEEPDFDLETAQEELRVAKQDLAEWLEENEEEMEELKTLRDEISSWRYGETMIDEDDWVEYVQDLLEDIGDIPRDLPDYIVIDWKATAENIKADYTEVTYQGTTYYVRAC